MNLPELAETIPDQAAAYEYLERPRWDGRLVCPHCASIGDHYFLKASQRRSRKTRTGAETFRRPEIRLWVGAAGLEPATSAL